MYIKTAERGSTQEKPENKIKKDDREWTELYTNDQGKKEKIEVGRHSLVALLHCKTATMSRPLQLFGGWRRGKGRLQSTTLSVES